MLIRLFALTVLSLPLVALAAPPVRVNSPDGRIVVELDSDPDGRPTYAVRRDGKPLLAPSRLGFLLVDTPKLDRAIAGDRRAHAQLRRNLGTALGRTPPHPQSLQRTAGDPGRER